MAEEKVETTDQTETVETTQTAKEPEAKLYPESYVKKIHTENAQRRQREKELEDRLAQFEKAELDREKDLEKRAKAERERADNLERQISEERATIARERILSKAEALAVRAGIREDAIDDLLLRPELASAKVEDLPQLIEGFKTSKAFWFAKDKTAEEKRAEQKNERAAATTPPEGGKTQAEDASKWDKARLDREWSTVRL